MPKCKCGQTHCCHENVVKKKIHQTSHDGKPEYRDGKPVHFLRKECVGCGGWQGDEAIIT